jgi:catechol 2,3-dioxygenase-like lactoylglutathione lyase family enzyme
VSAFIKRMAHVALCVPDLDASVAWATTVMGLRESERVDGVSYLTHGSCHHSLQYIQAERSALHHVAMEAHDERALDALAERLVEHGLPLLEEPVEERGVHRAIRFRGPEGHAFEVFAGMDCDQPEFTSRGVPTRKFGHPTITCEHTHAARELFERTLDFRLSDEIGDGLLFFLRCNTDHHGMGIQKGPPGLNHYAWNVESLATLGLLGDTLARSGGRFIWGPGRHGAGQNLFTYHFDPAGAVVEFYADLYQVWDERTYVPGKWSLDDHRGQNLWGPTTPAELIEAYTPLAHGGQAR